MPTFLIISRHSPENCAMFNEKARKAFLNYIAKSDKLQKKYGVKTLGAWNIPTEHLTFMVSEAPSLEAFQKLGMEPEILALSEYSTYEVKPVYNLEESTQMLQQSAK